MACYKLTSCTAGNTNVVYTNTNLVAYVGTSIEIASDPGACYTVELSDPPCNCIAPVPVVVTLPDCICNTTYTCYILSDCNSIIPPFYVSSNLNAYVGTTISAFEYPGECFNVIGVTDSTSCADNLPVPVFVTCVEPCICGPATRCYELTNCLNPAQIITVNSTLILTLNHVLSLTPAIVPPGGNNCWTVTDDNVTPCSGATGTTITAVVDYGINGCAACAGPPPCYQLESCDGQSLVYTQSNLAAYAGGPSIALTAYPGQCWFVTLSPNVCPNPGIVNPLTATFCNCPCYTLTNCRTGAIIHTNTDLLAFVGQSVHLDPPDDLGCLGDCWQVSINNGPCGVIVPVIVTQGCIPACGPCGETCYELVDCETDVVFLTVLNPTLNAVDLSTLISGQSIGQVNSGNIITLGCWYVRLAQDCASAVAVSVFTIYQPTQTQTGCDQCLNSCYGLLNCETLAIDYVIKYTGPNPYGLPNPATLTGAIGSLCFEAPTGCVTGCYQLQLIPDVSCAGSINWATVVSMVSYPDCFSCSPQCYLLTECAPVVAVPFVVNNDLSLYVGQVAKICDLQGVCHCYHVDLAQSCTGAITIPNANATFTTCQECNSCDCPPGYTKIGNICQKITTVPATANPTIYSTGPGSINNLYGNLGTNFYNNISALPFPITAVGTIFQDAALVFVPSVNNGIGVWGGPAGSRLNTIGIWTTVAPNPLNEWIGFAECIDIPVTGTYCMGIGGDDSVRIKIDGVLVVLANVGFFDFNYWHVFEINLTAGTHVITLEGFNSGSAAAFAAEIYNTTSAILQTYTTSAQVQAVTIFSTFPKRAGGTFQTGEDSGFTCAPGYTLNTCAGAPVCSLIETIPFTPCAPTYLVTDCSGSQPPYYTNTDLSLFANDLGISYRTCIDPITYSAFCFILKDCNRISPDIVTDTNLSAELWQVVALQGYSGSCFIVTGIPAGDPCVNPIPVVTVPLVMGGCPCPGAQQPWQPGCYCVTVEQVFPTIVAPDFTGVFVNNAYDSCQTCLQVCYLLTSCVPGINPVVVYNDLSLYVGQVIKIESCGDICWQVDIAPDCVGAVLFSGIITPFPDCVECLPPAPPTPPPFDLHLRKIKPGWNSPNKCLTLNYIEKTNCSFASAVYDAMLVNRYGITICCDEPLDVLDIRKQLMDLDMLKDPTLCKSTLCHCPPPCLIDAIVELLPFCGAPNIISAILNIPCPAPNIIDVVVDVPPVPAECFCFSVAYVGPTDITINFIDCCCVQQTMVLPANQPPPGITAVCAATAPFTYDLPGGPCGCPPGFTYNPTSGDCEQITTAPPVIVNPLNIVAVLPAIGGAGQWGASLYPDITSINYPISASSIVGVPTGAPCTFAPNPAYPFLSITHPQLLDGLLAPLLIQNTIPNTPTNQTWGTYYYPSPAPPPANIIGGRFLSQAIWNSTVPAPADTWWGVQFCVVIPTTGTYILGLGVAEFGKVTINGQLIIDLEIPGCNMLDWKLFPITLPAGNNIIKLESQYGFSQSNFGIAFEIYNATFAQLQAVASPAALAPYIVFTTTDLIGKIVTSGDDTSITCDPGCTLNTCGVAPICECITTAAFVPCLDVVNEGLCGEALLCNPPPPQICSCWKLENPGQVQESYNIGAICGTPFPLGMAGFIPPGVPAVYHCSVAPPVISAGIILTNMGDCDGYCGPVPPVCVCYHLIAQSGTCIINYIDCNGVPQQIVPTDPLETYVCSQVTPTFDPSVICNLIGFTMTALPGNCLTPGNCGTPFLCECTEVTVNNLDQTFWYYDCNGVFVNEVLSTGVYLRCGANFGTLSLEVSFAVQPLDCGLGECVPSPPVCVCYQITMMAIACEFAYIDCNGVPQLIFAFGTMYVCSTVPPTPTGSCPPPTYIITVVPFSCVSGSCGP